MWASVPIAIGSGVGMNGRHQLVSELHSVNTVGHELGAGPRAHTRIMI